MARSKRRDAGAGQRDHAGHEHAGHGHEPSGHEHGHDHGGHEHQAGHAGHEPEPGHAGHDHGHPYDRLGNPQDMAAYLARLEGEDRLAWQKPDEVIRLLGVKRGDRVCDVGVGPGYFALRLARAVGPQGEVYAFDAEPRMLEVLRQRIAEQRLFHVHPILAEEGVPPRPCDLVLVVNTFHHFRDGAGYLRRLAGHLKPGGRIANIDFHKRDLPVGPPTEHKVARDDFLAIAREAGLKLAAEHDELPYQYFLVLEPEVVAREAAPAAPAPAGEAGAARSEPVQPEETDRPGKARPAAGGKGSRAARGAGGKGQDARKATAGKARARKAGASKAGSRRAKPPVRRESTRASARRRTRR